MPRPAEAFVFEDTRSTSTFVGPSACDKIVGAVADQSPEEGLRVGEVSVRGRRANTWTNGVTDREKRMFMTTGGSAGYRVREVKRGIKTGKGCRSD